MMTTAATPTLPPGALPFPGPLIEGVLVQRYKRFLCDVRLADGSAITAHCANSGSMRSVALPGARVWLSRAPAEGRKYPYTWELIEIGAALVGINTARPNAIVAAAIAAGHVPELRGYAGLRREVKYGRASRIDLLLEDPARPPCYVEIKNVTMRRDASGPAEFPDARTVRGAKHLDELAAMVEAGARAVAFYLVHRPDCDAVTFAADLDPAYAAAFARAQAAGVEAIAYGCAVALGGVGLAGRLPIVPGA